MAIEAEGWDSMVSPWSGKLSLKAECAECCEEPETLAEIISFEGSSRKSLTPSFCK